MKQRAFLVTSAVEEEQKVKALNKNLPPKSSYKSDLIALK